MEESDYLRERNKIEIEYQAGQITKERMESELRVLKRLYYFELYDFRKNSSKWKKVW